jgi:ribosomal protein L37AE/L43A
MIVSLRRISGKAAAVKPCTRAISAILLPMQTDPSEEWRRLTEQYRDMSDEELHNLAADFEDLTENARQALRQEMRSRGLGDPAAPPAPVKPIVGRDSRSSQSEPGIVAQQETGLFGFASQEPELVSDDPDTEIAKNGGHDYTWKTELCECETPEQAGQLKEALRREGIECWFTFNGYTASYLPRHTQNWSSLGGIQIMVAADQLEQARAIAAKPIPQEIIDESKIEVPDYEVPKCPRCGANDPTLEAVAPANQWHCEQCGAEWSDPAEVQDGKPGDAAERTP